MEAKTRRQRGRIVRTAERAGSVSWWGRSSCWPAWTTPASWPPPPPCCCLERAQKHTNKQTRYRKNFKNNTLLFCFCFFWFFLQWIEPDIKITARRVHQHMHMKSDEADKRRSCCPRRVSVSTRYSCVGVNTLLAYVPCVNIHLLHTMPSQRQYGFNRGGINSAITVERLYGAKPLTVGQYISHQSLSRPSKKKKKSLGLSTA